MIRVERAVPAPTIEQEEPTAAVPMPPMPTIARDEEPAAVERLLKEEEEIEVAERIPCDCGKEKERVGVELVPRRDDVDDSSLDSSYSYST